MSDPIIPRRIIHEPNDASIRRAFHSNRDDGYIKLLERVKHRQNAEEFGRWIGIILHWLIIKPLQLVWLCLRILGWCVANFYQLMIVVFVLCVLYLGGVVVWLTYLTHWK